MNHIIPVPVVCSAGPRQLIRDPNWNVRWGCSTFAVSGGAPLSPRRKLLSHCCDPGRPRQDSPGFAVPRKDAAPDPPVLRGLIPGPAGPRTSLWVVAVSPLGPAVTPYRPSQDQWGVFAIPGFLWHIWRGYFTFGCPLAYILRRPGFAWPAGRPRLAWLGPASTA